jgi:alcohol dehydrogenase class IV
MSDNLHDFGTVARIRTGRGALSGIGDIAAGFGTRCVLVTGRDSMRRSGVVDRALRYLAAAGVTTSVFEGVGEDPTVSTVDSLRRRIADTRAQFVIGLGGGSAMDAAKAAGGLSREEAPTADFLLKQTRAKEGLPVIAVPTTSGTGAEVTPNAVISDPQARLKASLRNGQYLPAAAIVDPELTVSCPPRVTAYSGLDAITQAVESFVSIHATPLTDALAFEAFRLLWSNVERAYANGSDMDARAACSYGSLLAGMALANARLGAVHGIAHPLGVRYSMPHGLVCALLLPEVVKMNLPCSAGKFARLDGAAGMDLVEGACALNRRLGIYEDFGKYSIPEEDYGVIADESLLSGSMKANPKRFTREDVIEVLRAASGRRGGSA